MKKKEFQNLPSTETPINAENLNEMQDNIEESCVIVSPTEPTTNEKVWIQKGKNLFNKDSEIIYGYYLDATNGNTIAYDQAWYQAIYINVLSNTNYILSSEEGTYRICFYDKNKNFISRINTEEVSLAFATPENCKYIRVSGKNTELQLNSLQIEQGSTATEYEAYIEPVVWLKNDNGVYEPFYKEEKKEKVLWTNPNPTSGFSATSITLNDNIEKYSYYEILFKDYCTDNRLNSSGRTKVGFANRLLGHSWGVVYRNIEVSTNILTVASPKRFLSYGGASTDENDTSYIVPYQIIGYK